MVRRAQAAVAAVVAGLLVLGGVVAAPSSADPPGPAADGPTVSLGDQSGLERDSVTGSVFVPVYLSEPAAEPVVVAFHTTDGTAVAGADYLRWGTPANPRTVTIPAGALQGQINVPLGFADPDPVDKTFSVVIAQVSGGDAVVGRDTATATIVDSDAVFGPNPAINVSNPMVIEGDAGQRRAQFQIHLSRPPSSPVTVTYATVDGTAVAGEDYLPRLPGTVVFAPGQISRTVDVLVDSNTVVDGDRDFSLEVDVIGGSPVEELTMTGVATILDDDTTPAEPCPPGTFNPDTGAEPCEPAPPGTFVDTEGATEATPCAPGSYQDQTGRTSCQLAPIGSYVDTAGATAAMACPDGTTTPITGSTSPDDCVPLPGAITVSAGGSHTCALLADGSVSCWGSNNDGQLGIGTQLDSNVPVPVVGVADATDVTAGTNHTCALLGDGTISCWGYNFYGQLGSLPFVNRSTVPVAVNGITNAVAVAAGGNHTCALLDDGTLACWGHNSNGQLGDGTYTTSSSNSAVPVVGVSTAVAVTAGSTHSCSLLNNGSMTCWGRGANGQLGVEPAPIRSNTPVAVTGISDAVEAEAGNLHTCALLSSGSVRCWGANGVGQLGDGTFMNSNLPVVVSGLANTSAISAGSHSCALLTDGSARCWGGNIDGRLGNGTNNDSNVPVAVVGLTGSSQISAGNSHSCVVLDSGSLRCWGSNSVGQLGNGTNLSSNTPATVTGIP